MTSINKVFLEDTHNKLKGWVDGWSHQHTIYGRYPAATEKLITVYSTTLPATKLKIFTIWVLAKKFADSPPTSDILIYSIIVNLSVGIFCCLFYRSSN